LRPSESSFFQKGAPFDPGSLAAFGAFAAFGALEPRESESSFFQNGVFATGSASGGSSAAGTGGWTTAATAGSGAGGSSAGADQFSAGSGARGVSAHACSMAGSRWSSGAGGGSGTVTQPKQPEIRTAYLYKLSKAMPMTTDMPNLLLELSQVVQAAGVKLTAISPTPPDVTGTTGITLTVSGDFYSLTDLLYRLRNLVAVHDGALDVSGRLFSINSVSLTPGTDRSLGANISLSAYTFGDAAAAAALPVTTPASTDTTATTTDATTTTAPSASADVTP
jgi:hypothetical protein